MKFRFCSDGDCPLWALAALHALGSLPAPLFRNLLQHVIEEQPDDGIREILKDTSLSSREECARAAAVIRWVLHQTWRCACPGSQLTRDLLVLGVPRSHAAALADVADSARDNYLTLAADEFKVNRISDATLVPGPENAVDTYKLTLFTDTTLTGEHKRRELLIDKHQAKTLLEEMKKAYRKIELLEQD